MVFDLASGLVASVSLIALAAVATGIMMPICGAMVRLRAEYKLLVDDLEGTEKQTEPKPSSFFGIMARTKRLEGWAGLYKGAYPTFAIITISLDCAFGYAIYATSTKAPKPHVSPVWMDFVSIVPVATLLLTVVTLPLSVIINRHVDATLDDDMITSLSSRCIVTPYRLPDSPIQALRIILSPREFSRPYTLYANPGLLSTTLLTCISFTLVPQTVRLMLLDPRGQWAVATWWHWALCALWLLASSVWLTPLYVVGIRLSVQQNVGNDSEEAQRLLPLVLERFGADEDVATLRPINIPYTGLMDCERKMVDEEGFASLYRGWVWAALGNVVSKGN